MRNWLILLLSLFTLISSCNNDSDDQDIPEVLGCTDPESANYNPDATISDNSCLYTVKENVPLISKVTATWCPPCGENGMPGFKRILNGLSGTFTAVSCHVSRSLFFNESSEAFLNYSLKRYVTPTILTNHYVSGAYSDPESTLKYAQRYSDSVRSKPVVAALVGTSTYELNELRYDISADVWAQFFEPTEDVHKIAILIIQDSISNFQNGSPNDRMHRNILNGYVGDEFAVTLKKSSFQKGESEGIHVEGPSRMTDMTKVHVIAILFKETEDRLEIVNTRKLEFVE